MSEPEIKTEEEVAAEAKEAEAKKAEEYSKAQQQIDQERANTQRAQAERDVLSEELTDTHTEIESLKSQIAEVKTKSEKTDDFKTLDADMIDPAVVHNLKILQDKLNTAEKQLTGQQTKIDNYEAAEIVKVDKQRHEETVEEIYSTCDEEFGPKFRNDAIKLADELVKSGKEKAPDSKKVGFERSFIQGLKLMRRCYKQVSEDKKASGNPVPTDSGGGGVPFDDTKKKTGTRQEVLADMRKKGLKSL